EPHSGTGTNATSAQWLSSTIESSLGSKNAFAEIPLNLAVTSTEESSVSLACATTVAGANATITAEDASLVAVQTSGNS
ncbi:MAG TPA: hypothetical protein VMB91_00895, partial [Solirubrobacteraceae bacterium]|nr:hypothetical protein [Solirubrobacteraceae bacterium]